MDKLTNELRLKFLEELLIEEKMERAVKNYRKKLLETKNNLFEFCVNLNITNSYVLKDIKGDGLWSLMYDIKTLSDTIVQEVEISSFDCRYKDLKEREESIKIAHEELRVREEELLENIAKFNEYKRKNYLTLKDG